MRMIFIMQKFRKIYSIGISQEKAIESGFCVFIKSGYIIAELSQYLKNLLK